MCRATARAACCERMRHWPRCWRMGKMQQMVILLPQWHAKFEEKWMPRESCGCIVSLSGVARSMGRRMYLELVL